MSQNWCDVAITNNDDSGDDDDNQNNNEEALIIYYLTKLQLIVLDTVDES